MDLKKKNKTEHEYMNISSPPLLPTYRFSAATSCLRTSATQINLKRSIPNTKARKTNL